jgi:hypothetical protein
MSSAIEGVRWNINFRTSNLPDRDLDKRTEDTTLSNGINNLTLMGDKLRWRNILIGRVYKKTLYGETAITTVKH